jgi:isoleucyl-tRNA synthetase
MSKEGQNYKDTVNLPKTDFPMKADLVIREPQRLEKWEMSGLYRRIQQRRRAQGAPKFILHDGPPFANGDVHMGTALNKVIKDLVLKSKTMAGFETPYIPGWDCHGLPIEFKVVKEAAGLSAPEIRRRCEEFARKWLEVQRTSFRRLGVFGEWEQPYLTLSADYEAEIVRFFATCLDKNLVYRDKRPVQWSYGAKTALAEAEVEYKQKTSPAVYVRFPAKTGPVAEAGGSFVIWTTTPWTLPANLGIMVKEDYTYVLGEFTHEDGRRETLLILKTLVGEFTAKTGFNLSGGGVELTGRALAGSIAQHPFLERESKVICSEFVTGDTGTGQVHTAPGHGKEDYLAGRENGLGLISPVDDDGKFTAECGLPNLVGLLVFDADPHIIRLLAERDVLLGKENYKHDYPHCWRSKTPIIFRSVEQFFLKIDEIREKALREIASVQWLPPWGRARIYGTAESRPDWCISRQRTWGVPLPVFYKTVTLASSQWVEPASSRLTEHTAAGSHGHAPAGSRTHEPVLDPAVARKVAALIEQHGTNVWFEKSDAELTAMLGLPGDWTKGRDTLDVWIDSGCSSIAITEKHPELGNGGIADLYLEATDQHRGWFQSSLMCSVIHRGTAPYKAVMTHGFVTDTSGEKISKSGDKPINAEYYYNKYGADLVRLWVSSVDWTNDVPFSDKLFEQNGEVYRRFRNTLRILLGNLSDFDPAAHAVPQNRLTLLDRWILERLHDVTKDCLAAYAEYDFRKVFITLNQFCAVDLSAFYVDITKDRMYCDAANSPRRRSAQTAMSRIFNALCRLLAPILAFTADEAWEFAGRSDSVHEQDFPHPDPEFAGNTATEDVELLKRIRSIVFRRVEEARKKQLIGSNLEAAVTISVRSETREAALLKDKATVMEFLIIDDVQIAEVTVSEAASYVEAIRAAEAQTQPGELGFVHLSDLVFCGTVRRTSHSKCQRCWRHLPEVGSNECHPALCGRCADVLSANP